MAEHVRIDEGVKRGKRIQHRPGPGALRRNEEGQVEAIPPDLDPDVVLKLYLDCETTSHIAHQLGIKRKSLVAWLRDKRPKEWRKAQAIRALMKKEDGEEGVEQSRDALSLARARETLRAGQWELTALDPDYAPKQEITHNLAPILTINVAALPNQLALVGQSSTVVAPQLPHDSTDITK